MDWATLMTLALLAGQVGIGWVACRKLGQATDAYPMRWIWIFAWSVGILGAAIGAVWIVMSP